MHYSVGFAFYTSVRARLSSAPPCTNEKACRKLSTDQPISGRDAA